MTQASMNQTQQVVCWAAATLMQYTSEAVTSTAEEGDNNPFAFLQDVA